MTCGICSGPLRLRYRGDAPELVADAFAPSCHSVSGYADLYACERCGTVQQPDLPSGAELHDLYRGMRDDAYLAEEAGRRAHRAAPARRDRAPRPARADARGRLRPRAAARRGARPRLERRGPRARRGVARARPLARARRARPTLEEARAGGRLSARSCSPTCSSTSTTRSARCARSRRLLAPGGVTLHRHARPASRTARLAGSRWWGYLPSHTYLIPHRRSASCSATPGSRPWRSATSGARSASATGSRGLGERSGAACGRAVEGGAAGSGWRSGR